MKKAILYLLLTVSLLFLLPEKSSAGGPSAFNISLTPSISSALANATDEITVSVYAYEYKCSASGPINYYYTNPDDCAANGHGTATEVAAYPGTTANTKITASDGAILSSTTVSPDASGHASFTVRSASAGTKSISAAYSWDTVPASTIQVTFTSPAPAAASVTPATPTKIAPKTTPTTPAPAQPPAAPVLAEVKVGDAVTTATNPQIDSSKPLVLSGKTVPNGTITLTIHSTPRTVTAVADANGDWNYTVTGLEPGDHYVEAAVTDPVTKLTSSPVKILSFTLTKAKQPKATAGAKTVATAQPKKSHTTLILAGAAGIVVILAAAGWIIWKRRQHKGQVAAQPAAPVLTPAAPADEPSNTNDEHQS